MISCGIERYRTYDEFNIFVAITDINPSTFYNLLKLSEYNKY